MLRFSELLRAMNRYFANACFNSKYLAVIWWLLVGVKIGTFFFCGCRDLSEENLSLVRSFYGESHSAFFLQNSTLEKRNGKVPYINPLEFIPDVFAQNASGVKMYRALKVGNTE